MKYIHKKINDTYYYILSQSNPENEFLIQKRILFQIVKYHKNT